MVNNASKIETMGFISKHVSKLSPNNSPPKTLHRNLALRQ